MKNIKLGSLLKREGSINEKKNAVGKVPAIGLAIHTDTAYDKATKQLNIVISTQSTKAPEYIVPEIKSEDQVQEIVSGLESELGAATRNFSKTVDKILAKYQQ